MSVVCFLRLRTVLESYFELLACACPFQIQSPLRRFSALDDPLFAPLSFIVSWSLLTGSPFSFRPLPVGILLVNPFYELNEVLA